MNSTLCALSSVAHLSISMTMLLSSRRSRRAPGTAETATGSGSDDTAPTPPTPNIVHSDDELRRATLVAGRPPAKRRAAAVSAWRSALVSIGAIGKQDAPSHIKSLPNLILSVDDLESASARRKPADESRGPARRKATQSGSTPRRRQRLGREADGGALSAANEGLVTSDEESMESLSSDEESMESLSSDDDDVDNRSTDELVFVAEDEPRRPPRRRRSPLLPGGNTLASPRRTPQASPVNSTGVKIVIDRISSDDAEPTVVLGSPNSAERDRASAEAVAALHAPHSVPTAAAAELIEATPVMPNSTSSASRVSPSGKTDMMPESSSQVFLLEDMA